MLRTARPQFRRTSQSYSWLQSQLAESNSSSRTILQGTSQRILPPSSHLIYNNLFPVSQVQTRDFSSRNDLYSPYAASTAQIYSRIVRPLGPYLQLNPLHQQISARLQSSDSNNTKPDEATATPEKSKVEEEELRKASSIEVKVAEETGSTTNSKKSPPLQESEAAARIHKLVDSVRRVSNDVNTGDLFSVYGIVVLIALIMVAPMVVRHMRKSDSTYEDIDPEDPVADLAKIVRNEYYGDKTDLSVRPLALDSILSDLLKSKQFQEAVSQLVTQVIQSPEFKKATQALLKELWTDLIQDPETTSQVIHLLQYAIQDEQIKEAAIQLVMEVVNDKEVLDELTILLQRLGQEEKVQTATQVLLVESAHNALNDPEILDHSMEFAADVVGDDVVQRTAGEALYNTLSYAVRPTLSVLLSVLGAGLIVFSVAAFRNASAPEQEIDRALSATLKSLENVAATPGFYRILSLPLQFLAACKAAVLSVVMLPFKFVHGSVSTVGRAGGATMQAVNSIIRWMVGLPGNIASSLTAFLGRGTRAVSSGISSQSQRAVGAVSASFLGVFVRSIASSFTYTATIVKAGVSSIGIALVQAKGSIESASTSTMNFGSSVVAKTSGGLVALYTATIVKAGVSSIGLAFVQVKGSIESASMATLNFGSSVVFKTSGGFVAVENGLAGTAVALGKAGDTISKGLSVGISGLNGMGDKVADFVSKIVASISSPFGDSSKGNAGVL